ncbi:MAG TPA: hypothetical protein VFL13_03060 [Candidatus Baltobacteraceae bacterium]|nr:hypothetical protein [Candidatus Baltobacteraceae bacterium]
MMERILAVVALSAAVTVTASPSPNGTAKRGPVFVSNLAPADEYFGRAKLSVLVIRHRIFAMKDDWHHMRTQPAKVVNDANDVQDALDDWSARFPRDTWLPAASWNLATLYEELPGADAQQKAIAMLSTVRDRYTSTAFSGLADRDLKRGVGIRPWPQWALANDGVAALLAIADARTAWELATANEQLSGDDARERAIRFLALLVDRYGSTPYGSLALRDLERGVAVRR